MLAHFLSFAWRRIWREKQVNAIRVANLSIGLASGLVIFLVVNYMMTFDRYHPHMDRSYWVVTDVHRESTMQTDAAPRPLADVLRRTYPFVESAVRMETIFGRMISIPNGKGGWAKKFNEARNMCFTEPQYFDLFGVEWVNGNPKTSLSSPNTIVLSERYAEKYFNTTAAVGKTLRFDNRVDLTVTGIIKNPPTNTQMRYDALISYATIPGLESQAGMQDWLGLQSMCFVLLRDGSKADQLLGALWAVKKKHLPKAELSHFSYHVLPLAELNHQRSGMAPRIVLYSLIAVGLLLVGASCINYINLATAQALQRSREVGVRKVVGSNRFQLLKQFMIETGLLTLLSVVVALVLTQLAMPLVNQTLNDQDETLKPSIGILDLVEPGALLWFLPLLICVTVLSGFYPAMVLSGFNPAKALAGRLGRGAGGLNIRRTLITGQFLLTQLFLIVVLVITAQLRHMQKLDWGFRHEGMHAVWLPQQAPAQYERLKNGWQGIPGLESITFASDPPASPYNRPASFSYHTASEPEPFETRVRAVDEKYLEVFRLTLVAGRNFDATDTTGQQVLVNEILVKRLGLSSPAQVVGKRMRIKHADRTIVGVVKDFRSGDLHSPVVPVTLIHDLKHTSMAVLTFTSAQQNLPESALQSVWEQVMPDQLYKSSSIDGLMKSFSDMENLLAGFVQIFACIAIAMNCLGLYGLVTFMAETRAKEIGIRRILGARTAQMLWIFGKEFSKLMAIGFLFAAPLGWWLTSGWLQQYAHRIQVNGWLLLATIALMAVITTATILGHALKAAVANPVRYLRTQ
ncbi:ABC transporter permease [Dyadobacter fanqingshengii]|uniref:ABC transporter permease n=1 Tax=Dyadobacter fanqingshengii TaxID=2906443 RepID=A0A9X1P7X7_9BACT|nr:ABC transporter permease [Dyadobacter fanqingshengii]MCF0039632.1 ABC transporter permease [Dyadobacter fanqingshengii]USJ38601.1 ABC transporter permease [Dyadobacter fanqingshengii]